MEELRKAYETSTTGRVFNPISVVSIETPVRRQHGQTVPWQELQLLTEFCREHNLPVHLDGARIFNATVALNVDIKEMVKNVDSITFCMSISQFVLYTGSYISYTILLID